MKRIVIIVLLVTGAYSVQAQKVNWKKINSFKPDNILLGGERQPTQVLLLGSFHFGYPNLDAHKTDSSKFIDVLSPQRQKELVELAEVIKRFRPTRIYVESQNQPRIDSFYNEYLQGRYQLGRNEIYQVAFRIAKEMNHSRLFAVDTWPFTNQYRTEYKWIDSLWQDNSNIDTVRDNYWRAKFKTWYSASDSIETTMTMLENFLLMAEPAVLQRMHGAYMANGFNSATNAGPDLMSLWWYNRNLRIFNKILSTRPSSQDRIVVLFGNGHIPILKHCFYSSPEFEIVELKSLLK